MQQPHTLEEVRMATSAYQQHSNDQRPNQARRCGNQPPTVAHPHLAPLPPAPAEVDPDAWLWNFDGQTVVRRVSAHGTISLDRHDDVVGLRFARQAMSIHVGAATGELAFFSDL